MKSNHQIQTRSAFAGVAWAILIAAVTFGLTGSAEAQLQVIFKPDKKTYMIHEPVSGILTLTNRAGRDLILDGKNGASWLDFRVTDPRRKLISPLRNYEKPKPIVLKSGIPKDLKVTVNKMYPMGATGMYGVTAQVYFPPMNHYFQSNRSTVNIVDGQLMWSQTVGVPPGLVGAGKTRTYSILTFLQGGRERSLYFRLTDAETGIVRRTFSLGKYIQVHKPHYVVDSKSRLHVLHLAGPSVYAYTIIDARGDAIERLSYREHQGKLPELIVNSVTGEVRVRGGISSEETQVPYEEREFKPISERPPGMPRL